MDPQDEFSSGGEPVESPAEDVPAGEGLSLPDRPGRRFGRLRSRRLLLGGFFVAAVLAAGGIGYAVNQPPHSTAPGAAQGASSRTAAYAGNGAAPQAAVGAPAEKLSVQSGASTTNGDSASQGAVTEDALIAQLDQRLIVRTGTLGLEVPDVDKSVIQAQAAIVGLGGEVAQSQVTGTGDGKLASITYRVPVARWDDALAALRKIAGRVISEQTSSTDVTSQAIDLDARIANLKSTEQALQGIMTKATKIEDILAVQNQLTTVQGQIEQLTAQSENLKKQAAMSTLVATFQLPTNVVTTATKDWSLGAQIDDALAALVRVGQGLATVGVWALIVALPIGFGILLALAVAWLILRRLLPPRRPAQESNAA